jgi:alpha-glucosidase
MKPINSQLISAVFLLTILCGSLESSEWKMYSPNEQLEAVLFLSEDSGTLSYQLFLSAPEKKEVLQKSGLGLTVDGNNYTSRLAFRSKTQKEIHKEEYTLVSGKQLLIKDIYTKQAFTFETEDRHLFTIEFRLFNDGLAFRYGIQSKGRNESSYIFSENTSFNVPETSRMWKHPYDAVTKWAPGYETFYEDGIPAGTRAPEDKNGWAFPLLFSAEGIWALITEAGIYDDNPAMRLKPECAGGNYKICLPPEDETFHVYPSIPQVRLPWKSPWRLIITSDSLKDIVESNLVTSVSRENQIKDTDWIRPGRSSWSWWSVSGSPRDFNVLKRFVDFSAKMGWEYSLVDANWNHMENGSLAELAAYAADKNVGLLVWYNSGGPHNIVPEEPRGKMHQKDVRRQTFAWLQEIGIKGIKVDFFQSDKAGVMRQYHEILSDAARYNLVVNFHGNTIPRGWRRTYPNLLTMEAVKGAECYKFDRFFSAAAPKLHTIYPFTRNVLGPMDYTPVTFSHNTYPRFTSYAHELALSVIFESGIVHFADAVEAYQSLPAEALVFLKEVPVIWDETRLISGYPGKDAVLARRRGELWYIAGINGEHETKTISLSFDFLGEGVYEAAFIADGDTNQQFSFRRKTVGSSDAETVEMLQYGGFAAVIRPAGK